MRSTNETSTKPSNLRVIDGHTPRWIATTKHLVSEYINTWYAPNKSWSEDDRHLIDSLPGKCIPPKGACLLAVIGDEVVGCVLLRPKSKNVLEALKLYVKPSHRRTGVARILMEEAKSRAAIHHRVLALQVHADRLRAIALYRSIGFIEQEQKLPDYLEMSMPSSGYNSAKPHRSVTRVPHRSPIVPQ